MSRYAIYFMPEPSASLWSFGSAALGYDSARSNDVAHPETAHAGPEKFAQWSQTPRRYGFHATLKAPFHLSANADEDDLKHELKTLSQTLQPVHLGHLKVTTIGSFVALVPVDVPGALAGLASACVKSCESLRAPLTTADRNRRLATGLTAPQIEYLDRYGYPYVDDEFRFHMTLTGALEAGEQAKALEVLRELYRSVDQPVEINAITLARQEPDQPFTLLKRYELPR